MPTRTIARRSRSRYEDEFDKEDGYTPGGEDEGEEEAPRPSRRSRSARDEAPAPRRSRRSSRDEEAPAQDDDEDEAPRRSRRARSNDEDEAPAPRSRRTSRRDEDEEPPAPRSRRRAAREDPDEEEARPARRSRRAARSEEPDEEERPRFRRAAREEDEAPAPRRSRRAAREDDEDYEDDSSDGFRAPEMRGRRSVKTSSRATGQRGWNAYADQKKKGGEFADNFTPSEELTLIKFLDEVPFDSYREHWVDELKAGTRKSRTCLGDDCPLCEIGHQARLRVCFNIIDWSDVDKPVLKVWLVGVRLAESIKNFAEQPKTSPINEHGRYWSISRTGKGNKTEYNLNPVKSRDLDEDWDRDPLTEDEIEDLGQGQDGPFSKHESYDELAEVADQIAID